MKKNETNVNVTQYGGIGTLLTVLFVGLKLTGYIDWSWWWVFAPLWIPAVIIFGSLFLLWLTVRRF